MDFFEKAHVYSRNFSKKEKNMKRQLKQMLDGYKKSDNELIKNSGKDCSDITDAPLVLEDSSSVSGFSDLDLTMTEEEADTTAAHFSDSDVKFSDGGEVISSSDNSEEHVSVANNVHLNKEDFIEHTEDYLESVLEADEEATEILSDNSELDFHSFSEMSLIETSSQSLSDATHSEEFDPDGSLACKIMKNLEANLSNPKPKRQLTLDKKIKKRIKCKSKKNLDKNSNNMESEKVDNMFLDHSIHDSPKNESCPFISITATEMSDNSLSDIFDDYKYPTIQNLPCEKQNIVPYVFKSELFSIDDEVQIEDADSLIPEVDESPVAEDIEMYLEPTVEDTQLIDQLENNLVTNEMLNSVVVYNTEDSCIFVLKNPAEIYVNGKVKIKPLGGTIEVFGNILKKEVDIYSPNNSFAHSVKTVTADYEYFGLFRKLTGSGLSVKDAESIVTSLGKCDGVICLSPLINHHMDFVDNHFSFDLFNKRKIESTAHRLSEASDKLGCNIYLTKPENCFQLYSEWEEAINCGLKGLSRGIVCGGKGVGKSTFLRYYVNRVLDNGPVLVVDLDPGQAEFTVAGCISATIVDAPLLGPNYTHLKKPEISYNIGMINTMDYTMRYKSTVADLLEYCHRNYYSVPWIVNTMGMTNNMGLKFIVLAIICTQPTFLVQIDSKVMKKRFECYLERTEVQIVFEGIKNDKLFKGLAIPEDLDYNFILTKHVRELHKQEISLPPREERYLNFLAYFGKLMTGHIENFLSIVPYRVSLSDLNIFTNVKVERDDILKVINGKIVALCQLETTDKGKVFTLRDKALVCFGHGLVRGVALEDNVLYLMTPEPTIQLYKVNTLLYADWAPELQGTEAHLPSGTAVPYSRTSRHNEHMRAPRRRFNPLQLLKMSRCT